MPKEEPLICVQQELIERLKRFPAEQDFTIYSENSFVQWCNGHCFMWTRKSEVDSWEVDEL